MNEMRGVCRVMAERWCRQGHRHRVDRVLSKTAGSPSATPVLPRGTADSVSPDLLNSQEKPESRVVIEKGLVFKWQKKFF